jgi:predicted phage terminase large subunit-like protein
MSQPTAEELVKLCAVDSELYAHTFFPKTFRLASPPFARELWKPLEDPAARFVNLIVFRGGTKTTRLRTFASKRIAYGISRTILYIGAAERDAIRSVQWIRTQVERNSYWSGTFGLRQGRKWEETQIEIEHTTFNHTIWVLAAGINGSLRGINFDDYRPDLIIIDDPQTDESAASEEQREKVSDTIFGAVANGLASAVEEPNAKLAMAITPQHPSDISQKALKDTQWTSRVFPCWTKETIQSPVSEQQSSWETMFPTSVLRSQKIAAIQRNKLSVFTREMECRLISREKAEFKTSWLQLRDTGVVPIGLFNVLAIDPVPPPSPTQLAKGLRGKDYEAQYVWGRDGADYHLLDFARSRGHQPSWSVSTALQLAMKWRVTRIIVDAVAYQRTLKWILEEEMKRRGVYFSVIAVADGMQKFARITGVLSGLASNGRLWVGAEHTTFVEQFEAYPDVEHDDDLDASALALQHISNPFLEGLREERFAEVEDLPFIEACP